jgi:hypothetical protein
MTSDQQLLEQAREMRKLILSRRTAKSKAQTVKSAQLFQQGNFTTVVLNGRYAGMSKRNPTDAVSEVGVQLATRRALDRMLG